MYIDFNRKAGKTTKSLQAWMYITAIRGIKDSMPSECENDFGPAVGSGCGDGFDFTLLFEQTILSILPAAAFLIASPLRINYLRKQSIRTRRNSIRVAKLVRTSKLLAKNHTLTI
jgi:hypothetical protein